MICKQVLKLTKQINLKELDEKFEFNFAQKERLDAKFTTLKKKIELEKNDNRFKN